MTSRILGRDEMQGFLENLDHSDVRGLNRIRAVVDHYFTCCIFPDLAKDAGFEYAANLMEFIRLAVLTDPNTPGELAEIRANK